MPVLIAPSVNLAEPTPYVNPTTMRIVGLPTPFVLPSGSLRIGGDAPDGLVLLAGSPVARTVRVLDMESGELISETTSDVDGTYAISGLSARTNGYAVWIVGNAGERGVIVPSVMPG